MQFVCRDDLPLLTVATGINGLATARRASEVVYSLPHSPEVKIWGSEAIHTLVLRIKSCVRKRGYRHGVCIAYVRCNRDDLPRCSLPICNPLNRIKPCRGKG